MFTGACTKDEDCENATIETGIDNCASMPHYPKEVALRSGLIRRFLKERLDTLESLKDETQSGNMREFVFEKGNSHEWHTKKIFGRKKNHICALR